MREEQQKKMVIGKTAVPCVVCRSVRRLPFLAGGAIFAVSFVVFVLLLFGLIFGGIYLHSFFVLPRGRQGLVSFEDEYSPRVEYAGAAYLRTDFLYADDIDTVEQLDIVSWSSRFRPLIFRSDTVEDATFLIPEFDAGLCVYLREDVDYRDVPFVIEGAEHELYTPSSLFLDTAVANLKYSSIAQVTLRMAEHPCVCMDISLFLWEGDYYGRLREQPEQIPQKLTDEFVAVLKAAGHIG